MNDNIKKILEQQVELLSEQSKNAKTHTDLAMLTEAMVRIADILNRSVALAQ